MKISIDLIIETQKGAKWSTVSGVKDPKLAMTILQNAKKLGAKFLPDFDYEFNDKTGAVRKVAKK